ncbi:MAG: NnrS family protein, partial [Mangrovicoccus sp.]
ELVYGYVYAALAGFLLTAAPSWTKEPHMTGWPLAGLLALWLLGRLAMLASGSLPAALVAVLDLAMPALLTAEVGRMILKTRNWRNLSVLAAALVLLLGNVVFHLAPEAHGMGIRLGVMGGVCLIAVVGGRIVPAFTRNWLKRQGSESLPPTETPADYAVTAGLGAALLLWVFAPDALVTGLALLAAGIAHLWRLSRWQTAQTRADALVWVLHAGYVFVPLGALVMSLSILAPGAFGAASAQHLWMVGAIGVTTLAVMTRATLAHSGGALKVGPATVAVYSLAIAAALLRPLADLLPGLASLLYTGAGLAWIAAFAGFIALYGKRHLLPSGS